MRRCVICHEPRLDSSFPTDVHVCRTCELTQHHASLESLTPERFVAGSGWRLAKTMLDNPHQYTVRDLSSPDAHGTTAMGHEEFEWFARMITDRGEPNIWWGREYRYLYVGGWFYWTMGLAPEMTTIINRKATSAASQIILDKQVEDDRRRLERSQALCFPLAGSSVGHPSHSSNSGARLQFWRALSLTSEFKFIDLFAGIGGMRRGFERAGGSCVFTSEWNKFSQETYRANFGSGEIAGDITKIAAEDIPNHDVLVAGFPCQPFSLAGVSKKNALGRAHGFEDETQGTLFFDVARIIKYHQPEAFLLENVKNLLSHDGGKTFSVIVNVLTKELGYSVQWRLIDAKGFVPQHRERIFLVGFREERGFDFSSVRIPPSESGPRMSAVLHPQDGSEIAESPYTGGVSGKVNPKYTLTPNLWTYLQGYAEKHRAKGNGFGFGMVGPQDVARTLSARYYKDGAEILVQQLGDRPRRLTPRECSRLMGFDLPGGSNWRIPVSDTQAYRQFGNAVVAPVVEAIAEDVVATLMSSPASAAQGSIFALAA